MKILHYNDEEKELHRYLAERGQANTILPARADVFSVVRDQPFAAAYVGLHPYGLQLIRALHRKNPDCLVTIITSDRNTQMAVEAMKLGAFDYLLSPLDFTEVERSVLMMMREQESQQERRTLEGRLVDAEKKAPVSHGRKRPVSMRSLAELVAETETAAIRRAILETQNNIAEAARALDISRTTLYAKMRQYRIEA